MAKDKFYTVQVRVEDIVTIKYVVTEEDEKVEKIVDIAENSNHVGVAVDYPLAYFLFEEESDRDNFFENLKQIISCNKIELNRTDIKDYKRFGTQECDA